MKIEEKIEILESLAISESIPPAAKSTYARILRSAGALGPCNGPSAMTLAAESGVSERAIVLRLKSLAAIGLIDLNRNTPVYIFHPTPEKRLPRVKPTPLFDTIEVHGSQVQKNSEKFSEKNSEKNSENFSEKKTLIYNRGRACAVSTKPTNQPNIYNLENGIEEDSEPKPFDAAMARDLVDFRRDDVIVLRRRVAWAFRRSIAETKPLRPEVIDRITAGIALGLPRFTIADCEAVAAEAELAIESYRNQFVRGGREFLYETINLRFADYWEASGGAWGPTRPGIEPTPNQPKIKIQRDSEQPREDMPTVDELLTRVRGPEVPPEETLEMTMRRLGVQVGEALAERATWKQIKKMKMEVVK